MNTTLDRMTRFFGNPVVGVLGSLASIVSLVLAIYFYSEGKAARELRFYANPARAVVAMARQTSRLSIALDGRSIDKDVSAAQVAFWNGGRTPIRSENMLRALHIQTTRSAPIVDVSVRKRSRDVVHVFSLFAKISRGAEPAGSDPSSLRGATQ